MPHPEPPRPGWEAVRHHPAWAPYSAYLAGLPEDRFPRCNELNALLPSGTQTMSGEAVRFAEPGALQSNPSPGYEQEIYSSGRVSTRADNLHDLCNALVWATFPRTKAALNHRHLAALPGSTPGHRGPVRDALTLFDECGGVFHCARREPLEAIARHDWQALFGHDGSAWPDDLGLVIIGHGTLEKLWTPYKAISGRCLLLHAPASAVEGDGLDRLVAGLWMLDELITAPRDLCPFPFMGIPGWWQSTQDRAFYEDASVFRPPASDRSAPPVFSCPS